jgi:phenylalanyl-tRNA synthetase beta chain
MKISYNWLKSYIEIDENPEKIASVLTQLGLEVSGIEKFSSIEGGLENFVIGEVLTCEKHPNADRLTLTTVKISENDVYQIVCGAPNVAQGQKVVVALPGAVINKGSETFEIKKSKIRGIESNGMICAEDELGIGTSHDGILVLPEDVPIGKKVADYFKIENDIIFEIDITPNRIDAASHIGVARDLAAYYGKKINKPEVKIPDNKHAHYQLSIEIENKDACKRYSGIYMTDIKVEESPEWLKNRLKAIGLSPINNIVDITNFVLHETGQPLHAFDGDKIIGNKIIVKTVAENTKFITLDGVERKLSSEDLMICNAEETMCIAGVFGGLYSGISTSTNKIFIESAWFNPTFVRKTAKRHQLSTDSSFRFERGADINITVYAALRAAQLIEQIGAGKIASGIYDLYPVKFDNVKINFNYDKARAFIGKNIDDETLNNIMLSLDIKIENYNGKTSLIEIPSYRVDVYRQEDVVEDILRIYGYNNVEIPKKISISINNTPKPDNEKITDTISDFLSSRGFNEIMCNSLISTKYIIENDTDVVRLHNPLSNDLAIMRHKSVFGGLEAITFNVNRKNTDLKFYEFGRTYHSKPEIDNPEKIEKYYEKKYLALWITGKKNYLNWNKKDENTDFYYLKSYVDLLLKKIGIDVENLKTQSVSDEVYEYSLIYLYNSNTRLVRFGEVNKSILKLTETEQKVFHAEFDWDQLIKIYSKHNVQYSPISKFPKVKRDLSMLIDKSISYEVLKERAFRVIGERLSEIRLFDVYEGKGIEPGKISYALSFIFEDKEKTMTDKQIDGMMNSLIKAYKELGAQIR